MESVLDKLLAHPEIEIRGDAGTKQLLGMILRLLQHELEEELGLGSLMRAQHALMVKLAEHASKGDRERYIPVIAQVAWWEEPERFLEATNRTIAEYLDWSYLPQNHPLRRGEAVGSVLNLFLEHPYCILAPLLRSVKNIRH